MESSIVIPFRRSAGLRAISAFALAATAACSSTTVIEAQSDGGSSNPAEDGGADGSSDGSASSGDGALRIVSLTMTAPSIAGGDRKATDATTVTFVAIVTDMDGLDTIAGGQLLDVFAVKAHVIQRLHTGEVFANIFEF